jgi:pimeloyl-ACP methyl ester carboxylesterase
MSNQLIQESTTIDTQDVRLHVRMAGSGYPLILLHGWPQTSYCWRVVMPLLAPHFRVIAPDLRGFGNSEKPDGAYDKRIVANDVLRLAEVLGYRQALVGGHDIGGRVAYRILAKSFHCGDKEGHATQAGRTVSSSTARGLNVLTRISCWY